MITTLAIAMTCGAVLTGCDGNGNSAGEKKEAADTTNNLYGYDEPIKLKVGYNYATDVTWSNGDSPENNDWTRKYKENGFDLQTLYSVDASQSNQKLATAITSGNYPDILGTNGTDLTKYANSNVIADISDVYEKYATPELKEFMEYDGGRYLEAGKVDGKLYGLPSIGWGWSSSMMLFIRQDWLDNLNLEAPKTIDDLKEVALAFTKNDPDGNGKDDTYGLALNGKEDFTFWSGMQAFFESYGAAPGHWSGNFPFIEKDGKVEWGGADSGIMKKALTDLNEMYTAGSLAKGFASMDMNVLMSEIASGKCGMYFAPNWGAMVPQASAFKNNENASITAHPLPDGNGEGSAKPYINNTPSHFVTVSSKCENPEALIKMANLAVQVFNNPKDDADFNLYGSETGGIGWKGSFTPFTKITKDVDDDKAIRAKLKGEDIELNQQQQLTYDDIEKYLDAEKDGTLKEKIAEDDPRVTAGMSNWTVWGTGGSMEVQHDIYYANDEANQQAYGTTATETMANKYATLNPMTLETIVKIISGSASVDSYDDFLTNWKKLGGDEVTKEAQEWWDQANK